jgi:hypothetical protein
VREPINAFVELHDTMGYWARGVCQALCDMIIERSPTHVRLLHALDVGPPEDDARRDAHALAGIVGAQLAPARGRSPPACR